MERLTMRNQTTNTAYLIDVDDDDVQDAIQKLAEYEDLEEQGLLLKLPCKCNEVVWVAEKGFKPHKALYASPSAMLDDIEHGRGIGYTKAEAEKALAEMGCE